MSLAECNTNNEQYNIDKYDGSFSQDESGVTIVVNDSINLIKDLDAAGLYIYLLCRPKNWKLNVHHLMGNFKCGRDKIYRLIDILMGLRLLSRAAIRKQGKFENYHYHVYLRPKPEQIEQCTPLPDFPEAVQPDAVNPDAYKTKNIKNKECIFREEDSDESTQKELALIRSQDPITLHLSDKYLLLQKELNQQCLENKRCQDAFDSKFSALDVTLEEMLYECVMFYALKPTAQHVSPHRFLAWIKREHKDTYSQKPDSVAHKLYRDLNDEEKLLISNYKHFQKYPEIGKLTMAEEARAKSILEMLHNTKGLQIL